MIFSWKSWFLRAFRCILSPLVDSDGNVPPRDFVYDNINHFYFLFFSVSIFCLYIFLDFVVKHLQKLGVWICIETQWIPFGWLGTCEVGTELKKDTVES